MLFRSTFTMRLDSGQGTADHTATIIPGSYSTARTGGIATVVSFAVEAESNVYDISAADAQMMIEFYNSMGGASISGLTERIERFATVDTNVLEF